MIVLNRYILSLWVILVTGQIINSSVFPETPRPTDPKLSTIIFARPSSEPILQTEITSLRKEVASLHVEADQNAEHLRALTTIVQSLTGLLLVKEKVPNRSTIKTLCLLASLPSIDSIPAGYAPSDSTNTHSLDDKSLSDSDSDDDILYLEDKTEEV